jgi:hypothetical protein
MSLPFLNNATFTGTISGDNPSVSFNIGVATGLNSFAINEAVALGEQSFACGQYSEARGFGSSTFGASNSATGDYSIAAGSFNEAVGTAACALGLQTRAEGDASFASGSRAATIGTRARAHGFNVVAATDSFAGGRYAHAINSRSWLWRGVTSGFTIYSPISTTRAGQFRVEAGGGVCLGPAVGINTDSTEDALTVVGNVSVDGDITANNIGTWASYNNNDGGPYINVNRITVSDGESPNYVEIDNNGINFYNSFGVNTAANTRNNLGLGTAATLNSDRFALSGGNTNGSNLVIGTNDNFNLNLETANTTRMTITSTGNAGIGTATPNQRLTVIGGISATEIIYASTGNSTNWQNTSTFVQNNSAEFALNSNNYSIDTDLNTVEQGIVLGGLFFRKAVVPRYEYRNYNNTITILSGTGISYGGSLTISTGLNLQGNDYLSFNNLNYFDGSIVITVTNTVNALTSINFSGLKGVTGNYQLNVISQRACSYPALEYIGGYLTIGSGGLGVTFQEDLPTISFPNLQVIGGALTIGGYGNTKGPILSSVSFPSLKVVNGSITLGGSTSFGPVDRRPFANLTTINLTGLEICNAIQFSNIPNLTAVTFPSLKIIRGNTSFPSCTGLREISFPSLEVLGGYSSSNSGNTSTPSLTSISFPNLVAYTAGALSEFGSSASLRNFEFGTNTLKQVAAPTFNVMQTLTQPSIDNLLKAFANLDGTNGTTAYTGGIINFAGSNSAPSYTGGATTTAPGNTFVRTGTTVVASVTSHGHTTGDIVTLIGNGASALNGTYSVTATNINEFQYTTPTSGSLTGSATVSAYRTTVSTDGFRSFQRIALRGNTITINYPA